jgi:SAM-dependent methyltransferase
MKSFADHFSAIAPGYASYRPRYPEELFEYLAEVAPGREFAWDCGAGSGQATLALVRRFTTVIATDASARQLAEAPAHPRVEYRVAPAESSGIADGSIDLVTVAQALHWFDLERFFSEVRRVLVPGGVLAVWTYGLHRVDGGAIDDLVHRFYHDTIGRFWASERRLVESGYRTIAMPFTDFEVPSFSMTARWTLPELLGYLRTWSASRRYAEEMGHDPVDALAPEIAAHWGAAERRVIEWPLAVRAGRCHPL